MVRVDYKIDRHPSEKEVRDFLELHGFDLDFVKSRTYCNKFYTELTQQDKQKLTEFLTEFARQPFIKAKKVSPDLLTKMFSSEATYLYWIKNNPKIKSGF